MIARLNVGGPSIQAITLSRLLDERGYETRLVRGKEGPREGSMDPLAAELDVRPIDLPTLQRRVGVGDIAALAFLVREIRRFRPDVLHTHAAKAGTLGRVAAVLALGARPKVIVHTFHGHVLHGYFPAPISRLFTLIERALAGVTTCIVAVSEEVREDLLRLRVAPSERIVVLPLGFDFSGFDASVVERRRRRDAFRDELGIPLDAPVVTIVARLEPIKRVDRFLRVANGVETSPQTWFLIVGDGALREQLLDSDEAKRLGGRLVWAGLRDDMPDVYFATDVLAVTSDNEGTAVSAIEAQAAGLAVISTTVGGMPTVVEDGETGFLLECPDEAGFARSIDRLVGDPQLRTKFGTRGSARARTNFSINRLVADIGRLYRLALASPRPARRSALGSVRSVPPST